MGRANALKRTRSAATPDTLAPARPPDVTSWFTSYWAVAAIVVAIACQVYASSLRGPFLFDDLTLPISSPFFRVEPFTKWITGVRPLLMMSFWVNCQISPTSTFSYHLTNVLLHAVNGFLVFAICKQVFQRQIGDANRVFFASLLGCTLFLLHPLQTESVAYIAGRSEVLSATFVLAAWLIYVKRVGTPVRALQSAAILVLFGLAAAAKEQAVATVPVILLLTDWMVRRGSMWSEVKSNWRLYIPLVFGSLIGAAGVAWIIFTSKSAGSKAGISVMDYFWTECRAILTYLRLFFFPMGQNADPDFRVSRGLDVWSIIALVAILACVWVLLRQRPLVRYGGLLFLAFILPTSSFIPLADPFVEHRLYLPIVGLAIAVSAFVAHLSFSTARLAIVCATCAVIGFVATQQRSKVWSSGLLFWQDVVEKSPRKARGYQHLTHTYVASQRCQEAVNTLERAKNVMPRDYFTLINWAQAYTCLKKPDAALQKLNEAAQISPSADVYGLMGGILGEQGKIAEAKEAFTKAIAKEPAGTDLAHVYRGNVALLDNNVAQAQQEYQIALSVNPYCPEAIAHLRRLEAEAQQGQRSRSIAPRR